MSTPINLVMKTTNVELEYYYHDLLTPPEMSPLHVVFGLRGVFAKQEKSFKPCTLIVVQWYKNSLVDPFVIPRPDLQEFMQRCLQQFLVYIWTKCKLLCSS
jgi:hypothetical protein